MSFCDGRERGIECVMEIDRRGILTGSVGAKNYLDEVTSLVLRAKRLSQAKSQLNMPGRKHAISAIRKQKMAGK